EFAPPTFWYCHAVLPAKIDVAGDTVKSDVRPHALPLAGRLHESRSRLVAAGSRSTAGVSRTPSPSRSSHSMRAALDAAWRRTPSGPMYHAEEEREKLPPAQPARQRHRRSGRSGVGSLAPG